MRLYTVDEELRVRLERDVRDWTAAGLLTTDQARALGPDLATDLRRTGPMLRSGLAMFTLVAGGAAIGLVMLVTDLTSSLALTITTAMLGTLAMAAASWLVRRFRLYRHGVEEALAMGAVALFGASAGVFGQGGNSKIDTAAYGGDQSFLQIAMNLYGTGINLTGANAYGPMLQGFKRIVCDCSRSAPVDEIVGNVVMSCVRAQALKEA